MNTQNFDLLATKEFVKDEIHKVELNLHRVEIKIEEAKADLTKKLYKSIYWAGIVQYLAITATILGIISFIIKK